jgi:hypothetical protein
MNQAVVPSDKVAVACQRPSFSSSLAGDSSHLRDPVLNAPERGGDFLRIK